MKQYMPMKPTKHGFSVWVRANSENGYVYQLECYTGKQGSTVKFELRWSQDLLGPCRSSRRCVYRQLFSGVPLFRKLKDDGIYTTGTMRSNRKMS